MVCLSVRGAQRERGAGVAVGLSAVAAGAGLDHDHAERLWLRAVVERAVRSGRGRLAAAACRPIDLREDLLECLNTGELARRQFRDIARVAGLVFQGYPGCTAVAKQLQASSGLLFDVFAGIRRRRTCCWIRPAAKCSTGNWKPAGWAACWPGWPASGC